MTGVRGRHTVRPMTRSDLHPHSHGPRIVSSAIVWNSVMPALGVALILGASILPTLAVAALAALAMHALIALPTRPAQRRRPTPGHRRVPHGH